MQGANSKNRAIRIIVNKIVFHHGALVNISQNEAVEASGISIASIILFICLVKWVALVGLEDPLEKELAAHSSILAWRIPWTEEAEWATFHGVTKSWTRLSEFTSLHFGFPWREIIGKNCIHSWLCLKEELIFKNKCVGSFPDGPVVKNLPANAGYTCLIPEHGRSHLPQGS